jgi:hypothetical protein
MAKDRWNGELEGLVRKANNIGWDEVRAEWEGKITGLVRKIKETGSETVSVSVSGVTTPAPKREG